MASWLFGGSYTTNVPIYFDIRLEEDTLWTPSDQEDKSYGHLNGSIVLCLNQALPVRDIKLHMKGSHYINWKETTPQLPRLSNKMESWRETTFYNQIWSFLPNKTQTTLHPGNHEFPLTIPFHKSMPETIEGLADCFIRYELIAEIVGFKKSHQKSRSITVSKRPDSLLVQPLSMEKVWPEKVSYEISMPCNTFQVGHPIQVDVRYTPLRKGNSVSSIKLQLLEYQMANFGTNEVRARERLIVEDYSECDFLPAENTIADWVTFPRALLPSKQLEHCLPSSQSSLIQIDHIVRVLVELKDPHGKFSQIAVCFSVSLYSNLLADGRSHTLQGTCDEDIQPPPSYSDYISDKQFFDLQDGDSHDAGCCMGQRGSFTGHDTETTLEDLSETPCYDMALRCGVSTDGQSPHYWDIVPL